MTPAERNEALWEALHKKNWTTAAQLVDDGADVNMKTYQGDSLIIWAYNRPDGVDWTAMEWLMARGANINALDRNGNSLLHLAAKSTELDYTDRMKRILGYGANVDSVNAVGATPLMDLILRPRKHEGIDVLLAAGANVNHQSQRQATPLAIAAGRGLEEIVKKLIEAGAHLGPVDEHGENALHAAATSHSPNMLPMLLELASPPVTIVQQRSRQGVTALGRALAHGKNDGVKALLSLGADIRDTSSSSLQEGFDALMLGAVTGDAELVEVALRLGGDPNARDEEGSNVLAYAINQGLKKAVKRKQKETSSHKGQDQDATPGPAPEEKEDPNDFDTTMLRVLVESGADPTVPLDRTGISPWLLTLGIKDSDIQTKAWEELVMLGFPLNPGRFTETHSLSTWKDDGMRCLTPLGSALINRNMPALQAFLAYGAVPHEQGPDGQTALHYIARISWTKEELVALRVMGGRLRQMKDETKRDEIQAQVTAREHQMMQFVVDAARAFDEFGADWTAVNEKGYTPIHTLVSAGRMDVLEALADRWTSDMRTSDGDSLIAVALVNGQVAMCHGLVALAAEAPADYVLSSVYSSPDSHLSRPGYIAALRTITDMAAVNFQDADGNTPLIVAAATAQEDVVAALLELGANPNLTNHAGETAMLHAVKEGKGDIIQALRRAGGRQDIANVNGETPYTLAVSLAERHVLTALDKPAPDGIAMQPWEQAERAQVVQMREEGLAFAAKIEAARAAPAPVRSGPSSMRM